MRLISCHIENYGKIKDTDYAFSEGITEYCRENGYGKTTLASFLRAMFYGMPAANKRTKQFNDREHFYPFGGGKFGGSLVFEMEGKQYRIERFFDKSSSTKDSLLVYCNGMPAEEFGSEIGKSIFGLDEEAFARTVFITADEMEISATSGINAKLNRYVDNTDGDNNFDSAIKTLHDKRKELKADRGNGGLLAAQREKISGLRAEIENFNRTASALGAQYGERETLCRQIREAEEEERAENGRSLLRQKWETYDGYAASLAEEKEKAAVLREKYPKGMPTQEELRSLRDNSEELNRLKERAEAAASGREEQERLETLNRLFAEGVPSEEEITETEERLAQIGRLRLQLEELKKGVQTGRQKELSEKFGGGVPDEEERAALRKLLSEYQDREKELEAARELSLQGQRGEQNGKPAGRLSVLPALFAVLLSAGGAAFLLSGQDVIVGSLLLGLGAALLIGGGVFLLRQRRSTAARQSAEQEALLQLQKAFTDSRDNIREKLAHYGYYSRNGVTYDFAMLEREAEEYEAFRKEAENAKKTFQDKAGECKDLLEETAFFLERYVQDDDSLREDFRNMQTAFRSLQEDIRDYGRLKEAEARRQERKASYIAQCREIREQMQSILSAYRMELTDGFREQLARWDADRAEAERLEKTIAKQEKELEAYREKHALSLRAEREAADIEALREELSQRRKRLAELDSQIGDAEIQLEKLPDKQNELVLAEEMLEKYREEHFIYSEAIKALETAEQTLQNQYVSPIKESFCTYSKAIEKAIGEKITMDKDFQITFERGGESRKDRHLSAGERSICALCFRLALMDNMYEEEQPFVIMDDPFVHLDAAHMESTAKVLRELAQHRQILYFCCHESRRVV